MNIDVKGLSFSYGQRPVLHDLYFTVDEGRLLSILGPNGVGKSTLFRCLLGLLKSYQGEIMLDGQPVRLLNPRELARRIAYIPQSHYPTFNYSVLDMVLMGTSAQNSPFSPPGRKETQVAWEAMERLGITDFAERSYTRLSGGERQLVLIARALAQRSRVLIMDEPTANLDYGNQMRVLGHIHALTKEGYTIIQSTHNPDQAFFFSHQLMALKDGRILAQGTPEDILTADLIQSLYGIAVEIESLRGEQIRVCVPRETLCRSVPTPVKPQEIA